MNCATQHTASSSPMPPPGVRVSAGGGGGATGSAVVSTLMRPERVAQPAEGRLVETGMRAKGECPPASVGPLFFDWGLALGAENAW